MEEKKSTRVSRSLSDGQSADRRDVLLGRALLFLLRCWCTREPPSVRTCSGPGEFQFGRPSRLLSARFQLSAAARIGAKRRRRGGKRSAKKRGLVRSLPVRRDAVGRWGRSSSEAVLNPREEAREDAGTSQDTRLLLLLLLLLFHRERGDGETAKAAIRGREVQPVDAAWRVTGPGASRDLVRHETRCGDLARSLARACGCGDGGQPECRRNASQTH